MAKKVQEVKKSKSEIVDTLIKCVELTIPFVSGIAAYWGIDIAAYSAAIGLAVIYVLKAIKVFFKD